MATSAQDIRNLIEEASGDTVLVRDVDLDVGGRRVAVKLVTPDLLTVQDVLEEARAESADGGGKEFNGRYLRKLVPRITYADFDEGRMEGSLVFPQGDSDPVYRRLTRHPTAFTALTLAAAEVVRPLQDVAASSGPAPTREGGRSPDGSAGRRGRGATDESGTVSISPAR